SVGCSASTTSESHRAGEARVRIDLRGVALALLFATQARAAESERPRWIGFSATTFVGDGLRFNNPYRLATVLGSTAQSVSRTASYADVGASASLGDPGRSTHGIAVRLSIALEGTRQSVVTLSYLLFRRFGDVWGGYARAGVPVVTSPETTWGLEAAGGAIWFIRAGIGIAAELVGDVF